jgi:uncharacterized protein
VPADPGFLFDGPRDASTTVALAHGAGAAMDSPFMEYFAKRLGEHGLRVVRFEFPYMAEHRKTGKKKPPDREPMLRASWMTVVERLGTNGLVIGGKSMGGRIASLIADDAQVSGLICLGYPFHPVGKPDRLRVDHLRAIQTPTLIVQGERDPFGNREEVGKYTLSAAIRLVWLTDGEHSFKPRKSSGVTEEENFEAAVAEIAAFANSLID